MITKIIALVAIGCVAFFWIYIWNAERRLEKHRRDIERELG